MFKLLNKKFFKSLSPIPHSIEVTKELSKQHELFVVTATHHKHAKVKIEWLLKYFTHIKEDNVIITHRKDLVNVDLLVDDGAHNIETFPRDTIVLDYAWNRHLDNTYKRAKDLLEVRDIINKLNN